MESRTTRRGFGQAASLAGVGFWVAGGVSLAESKSPNEKLNLAVVGVGGRGAANLGAVGGENIVALCDVDDRMAGRAFQRHPKAKRFRDFRKMLDDIHAQIDAVVVSTPDHVHAPACIAAMRWGKHVYVEKPLAQNVYECRLMADTARKMKVVAQLGNQHHADWHYHRVAELIKAGVIGKVTEVHCGGPLWPSRYVFPEDLPPRVSGDSGRPKETPRVPPGLDWDLWLGPAPQRPYHPAYCPQRWREWRDFGTGGLGDMGCHFMDPAFLALDLKYPVSVEAAGPAVPYERSPGGAFRYEFPARGELPPVTLYWHGAGSGPSTELLDGETTGTTLLVGGNGRLLATHAKARDQEPKLLPKARFADLKLPETQIEEIRGHHQDWIHCIRNGGLPGSSFQEYGGPLGETVVLGLVAFWAGKKIEWDSQNLKATNCPEADRFIRREYREGWEL